MVFLPIPGIVRFLDACTRIPISGGSGGGGAFVWLVVADSIGLRCHPWLLVVSTAFMGRLELGLCGLGKFVGLCGLRKWGGGSRRSEERRVGKEC